MPDEWAADILMLNPAVVEEVAFKVFKYPLQKKKIRKPRNPTLGGIGVMMALHLCTKVSITGLTHSPATRENRAGKPAKFNLEETMLETFIKHGIVSNVIDGM
ncbi:type 2 lactosamine alpha-2,3-sialyltransferase-like [Anneissia japonica]|uniref:type 2 lactosamine alpha-2,3-sialyltransferase-like n=1 Tax=Anneissia japonica TaxID=1529436 RepID=UPI001425AD6E|nr:type 2 lactosamine alpha-2,3-sialyltransferase-like [Anneissia japonica]